MATQHEQAIALRDALKKINEGSIPVISRDPKLGLKERAKLTRQLFKTLGLKGLRAGLDPGRNCFFVVVRFPTLDHMPCGPNRDRNPNCADCQYHTKIHLALLEILQRAFPREIDNSDIQTDYFDAPWIIHEGTGRG